MSGHSMWSSEEEAAQLVLDLRRETNVEEENGGCCSKCPCRRCPRVLLVFVAIYVIALVVFMSVALVLRKHSYKPHVVFIVVDDLGWGDVEWRDGDMRTPVLNQMRYYGILINNSYVHPLDSPSRAAIFSGLYPYHMGLQHETMDPYTPAFVPNNVTFLPQLLKNVGYKTYMVGPWHLGFCDWKYTPLLRGFTNFAGFYTGDSLDYYSHRDEKGYFDFRSGDVVDFTAEGFHSTHLLADRAKDFIFNHDVTKPLFMALAFQAVHSPAKVPDKYKNQTCGHITDDARQTMCALVAMVDEGIGNVTSMLRHKDMLRNTLFVVTSDNGGVVGSGSSNGLFRGTHGELFEGGTRVMTLVSGDLVSAQGQTYNGLFHEVDWLPTILSVTAVVDNSVKVDGINQWPAIRTNSPSPRMGLVYNIDEHYKHAAIRVDDFKLLEGPANFSVPADPHNLDLQLFNLAADPRESHNLADEMPQKLEYMKGKLEALKTSLVKSVDKKPDPKADPALSLNFWTPGWC